MSLHAGKRRFAPPAWAVVLTGLALAAFASLGTWQLGRAREKRALTEAFERGGQETADASGRGFAELTRYQRVRLRGSYDPSHQMLLDNMPSATGRPGYRVLTPLERADDRGWVLVDRGGVPLGATRQQLPDVAVGSAEREVSGVLDSLPEPGLRVGPAAAPGAAGWPRVLLFPTERDVESVLGRDVESRILPLLCLLSCLIADRPETVADRARAVAGDGYDRDLRGTHGNRAITHARGGRPTGRRCCGR